MPTHKLLKEIFDSKLTNHMQINSSKTRIARIRKYLHAQYVESNETIIKDQI